MNGRPEHAGRTHEMNSNRLALATLIGLLVVAYGQALYFYPRLPDTIAHHFGLSGRADAWGSKTAFVLIDMAFTTLFAIVFVGLSRTSAWIPAHLEVLPHLPHADRLSESAEAGAAALGRHRPARQKSLLAR